METNGKGTGFNFGDFLAFKSMITLNIIQIVYVVIAVIITLAGLITLFSSSGGYGSTLPSGPIAGFTILVFGNILWRIWCELIIVFFRINKSLNNIDNKTKE